MAHTQKSAARAIKRDFAQCLATGNHRAAQNDEPEPDDLTPDEIDEAFLARVDSCEPSAAQKASRHDAEALRIQHRMQDVRDVIGRH